MKSEKRHLSKNYVGLKLAQPGIFCCCNLGLTFEVHICDILSALTNPGCFTFEVFWDGSILGNETGKIWDDAKRWCLPWPSRPLDAVGDQVVNIIFLNCQTYLSQLQNVFVQIRKCICGKRCCSGQEASHWRLWAGRGLEQPAGDSSNPSPPIRKGNEKRKMKNWEKEDDGYLGWISNKDEEYSTMAPYVMQVTWGVFWNIFVTFF